MRAFESFSVRASPPPGLEPLWELATNLRWTWDEQTQSLFRELDPVAWDRGPRDPLSQLGRLGTARLRELADDRAFRDRVAELREQLARDLEEPRWFQQAGPDHLGRVAYFSPEFGIAEAIPQYSGGLGVLAGDHLRAASELGVPLIGVGLLYRHGYFRQELDDGNWQREQYPVLDPHGMALVPVDDVRVEVDLPPRTVTARVWRCEVGRVRLYLLDADVDENAPEDRVVTDRLYGGGLEYRIRQELLLGVGGVRALEAVGEQPRVFHTNEGHAAFLTLERARRLVQGEGLGFREAVEAVRASTVFTTHTSVPAGIDRFSPELIERYLEPLATGCGIPIDELMSLGRMPSDPSDAPFNMAVLAFHMAGKANGVSRLHGQVSRSLFGGLWPELETADVPISSITNGVHGRAWVIAAMNDLLERHVGSDWPWSGPERWESLLGASDVELWEVRQRGRADLVASVRERIRQTERARGAATADLSWCNRLLDPDVLTVGFARRFAAYKRATLLLTDPERLRALLLSADRPVQLVFAGKAHPADDLGKQMIQTIATFGQDPAVRHRIVFVPDYDIGIARALYGGADVWLNTPRRPHEACGTSGMKAALNGSLNCSVLDGWWDEMYDGSNGWAIPSAEHHTEDVVRDAVEADGLFDLLEEEIVPSFYDRGSDGVPLGWVERIRSSLGSLGPQVVASRMVRDYTTEIYAQAAERAAALEAGSYGGAKRLAAWRAEVEQRWERVDVIVEAVTGVPAELGQERHVTARVRLAGLSVEDVEAELLHGTVDDADRLRSPEVSPMKPVGDEGEEVRYEGRFTCERAGRYGFGVRLVPSHPDLGSWAELGIVREGRRLDA